MRKVDQYLLLICVVVALCVNCLILLSHWSVTSKVITLTLFDCAYLSVVSQGRQVLLAIWNMIKKLAGSWPQSLETRLEKTLKRRVTLVTKTSNLPDYSEDHGLWCDGYCCMHNPKNLYYKEKHDD